MNRDDIIRMAREANFGFMTEKPKSATHMQCGIDELERFFHMAQAAERETISEEWWMCVQSDLENGVKSLNEAATEKWQKEYPEISKFAAWLEARGNQ
jgi:transposase-like protein